MSQAEGKEESQGAPPGPEPSPVPPPSLGKRSAREEESKSSPDPEASTPTKEPADPVPSPKRARIDSVPASDPVPSPKRARIDPPPVPQSDKRRSDELVQQNQSVASHYNARPDQGLQNRDRSQILNLRNFNNWIKSVLLKKYIALASRSAYRPSGHSFLALDLCCGKLGDLRKWSHGRVQFVLGVDIALESLRDGWKRYDEGWNKRYYHFGLRLVHADCTLTDIHHNTLSSGMLFDLTSCQFALHYGFNTEAQALTLLRNASARLRRGGYFVGTIPRAEALLDKVQREGDGRKWTADNGICQVEFENDISKLKLEDITYGIKYKFTLNDALDGCAEFLVSRTLLSEVGQKLGLRLLDTPSLDAFKKSNMDPENEKLWHRMRVGKLSQGETQVTDLYSVFIFEKIEGETGRTEPCPRSSPEILSL